MGQPPIGSSPVGAATGNPGSSANALATLREAIKLMESVLPQLDTGSEPYKAALDSIQKLSKHITPSDENPGIQKTALRGLARDAEQSQQMQALMRSMGAAGGGGGAAGSQPGQGTAAGPAAGAGAMA